MISSKAVSEEKRVAQVQDRDLATTWNVSRLPPFSAEVEICKRIIVRILGVPHGVCRTRDTHSPSSESENGAGLREAHRRIMEVP